MTGINLREVDQKVTLSAPFEIHLSDLAQMDSNFGVGSDCHRAHSHLSQQLKPCQNLSGLDRYSRFTC